MTGHPVAPDAQAMHAEALEALLKQVAAGEASVEEATERLRSLPFENLGFARIDHHRRLRSGAPEVIYGPGKTPEQIARIMQSIEQTGEIAVATRIDADKAAAVQAIFPSARYEEGPRFLVAGMAKPIETRGTVAVVTAGTSDLPVAEEAARTLELFGHTVSRYFDVGVAGLHRVLAVREDLARATVVIVVAGMEGALASVVKGLIPAPVIAVPTSVGFGANFQGVSALLAMLTTCTPGVTVVNIDNGFGAAYAACLINTPRSSDDR